MNDKELAEKCRLTRAGVDKIVEFSDEAWEDVEEVLDLQLAKAKAHYEPLIQEAVKAETERIAKRLDDELGSSESVATICRNIHFFMKSLYSQALNTEIVPEGECFNCDGKGILKAKRAIEGKTVGELAWETILCVRCNGTGKLPLVTVEQAIKKVME